MIIAVANCIIYELDIDKNRLYRNRFHHSLLTDGLIRLINGEHLFPKGAEYNKDYIFNPINISDVEAIIWSPFIDQAGYYVNQRNWDGTLFPYSDELTVPKFGIVGQVPLTTVYLWWQEFNRLTVSVKKRICVLYPTKFLEEEPNEKRLFDGVNFHTYLNRILDSTIKAKNVFKDWNIMTLEKPELIKGDSWWAHYTSESMHEMLKMIENELNK